MKASESTIMPGVLSLAIKMWPKGVALARESQGSQVTAASILPATKAAPASPAFMSTAWMSESFRPFWANT